LLTKNPTPANVLFIPPAQSVLTPPVAPPPNKPAANSDTKEPKPRGNRKKLEELKDRRFTERLLQLKENVEELCQSKENVSLFEFFSHCMNEKIIECDEVLDLFSDEDLKERFESMLAKKKPSLWRVLQIKDSSLTTDSAYSQLQKEGEIENFPTTLGAAKTSNKAEHETKTLSASEETRKRERPGIPVGRTHYFVQEVDSSHFRTCEERMQGKSVCSP
jgi:hypothetical protein